MFLKQFLNLSLLYALVIVSVYSRVIEKHEGKDSKCFLDYAQCPFTNAIETGRIKDPELKETSGLVASHKNYGVFYAIQDSLNPDPVYAINQEGDLLGIYYINWHA